jgi:cytochrome P450
MFDRYVIEDCRVFGHAFKRGDTVKCLLETTNRGQWCIQNQTRLIKPRGPVNVAFGGGIRPVSAPLARLELRVALRVCLIAARQPDAPAMATPITSMVLTLCTSALDPAPLGRQIDKGARKPP